MRDGLIGRIERLMKQYTCKECSTPLTAVCPLNAKTVTWRCENNKCSFFMLAVSPKWVLTDYDVKFLQANMIDPFH